MFPVGKQICQQLVVLNKSAFAERNFKQTCFIRIIPWMGFLRIIHWCRKLSAMKIRFNLFSPEFMELRKLISEKKKKWNRQQERTCGLDRRQLWWRATLMLQKYKAAKFWTFFLPFSLVGKIKWGLIAWKNGCKALENIFLSSWKQSKLNSITIAWYIWPQWPQQWFEV